MGEELKQDISSIQTNRNDVRLDADIKCAFGDLSVKLEERGWPYGWV